MSEKLGAAYSEAISDLNSISDDTDYWRQEFIVPFESIRSFSKVNLAKTDKETDPLAKMTISSRRNESRAHAFLRYIGFPIVSPKNKKFYNSGFDSTKVTEDETIKNIDLDFNSSDLKLLMFYRESDYINRGEIFVRQDNASSLYALSLRFPKPFGVLKTSKGPLDVDHQTGTVENRNIIIDFFYKNNSNLSANKSVIQSYLSNKIPGKNLTQFRHVLRPFVLDPDVTKAVNPSTSEICVPFLQNIDSATSNGANTENKLYRPYLEAIIRARLAGSFKDSESNKTFLQNIISIYENRVTPPDDVSNLDSGTLSATAAALSSKNDLDTNDIKDIFGEFTPTQTIRVSYYIKLIKVAVKVLYKSINIINEVLKKTNWVPIPDPDGPEYIKKAKIDQNQITPFTSLDKAIVNCKAAKAAAAAKEIVGNELKFLPPEIGLTNKDNVEVFATRLREIETVRDNLSAKAFKSLRDIEIITGEISGLGIIDIWAVHAALWALDETSLINLLDDRSFGRMIFFNPELRTSIVMNRFLNNSKQDIETTLKNFEKLFINILTFANSEFEKQFKSPNNKEGSSVGV